VTEFFQQVLNGLLLGGVYALFAVGLTLSLGVARVMNLAHGVTLSLAAIAGVKLSSEVDIGFPLLLVFGAIVGGAVGALLELFAFRPLRAGLSERNIEMPSLVASLAVVFILQTIAQHWTNAEVISYPSSVFQSHQVDLGPLTARSILLVTFVIAVVLVTAVWAVLTRTQAGRAVRAVAMDEEAAGMVAINARQVKLVTMVASGALAGIAGILIGLSLGAVDFNMGESQILRGFTVVILGGIGSVPGALFGGLLLGVTEGVTVDVAGSSWQAAASFVLLFAFLVARPQGIFGKPLIDRA
jgi:branched-chain amino acid transport system permease protein